MTTDASITLYEWDERGMFYDESRVTHDLSLRFVTHADYRALEEELKWARSQLKKATEELASIKARVGDVEKKDPDICNREYANGWNACRLALDVPK